MAGDGFWDADRALVVTEDVGVGARQIQGDRAAVGLMAFKDAQPLGVE